MTMLDVTDAVCALLHKRWPNREIYRNACPADTARPALLVETRTTGVKTMNRALYEESARFTVSSLGATDENGVTDVWALAGDEAAILQLLEKGYLRVEDRAVRVKVAEAMLESDRCKVGFDCSFIEERENCGDDYPLMQEIHSRTEV